MRHLLSLALAVGVLLVHAVSAQADLLGYWSGDSSGGTGTLLVNDQGNADLDGEIFGTEFTADGEGHTGMPGDFAVSFPGDDDDYVVIPATEETFEEITITAWVNGIQMSPWAGLVVSRDAAQPIGLDFHDFDGMVNYIWNDDAETSWGFISDVLIPEDEWTLVALTIDPDKATLYAGAKGEDLEFAVNEVAHFPQDNFTEWRWAEDDGFAGARNFSGFMDDVSIWNQALAFEDISRLHDGSATPLTLFGDILLGDYNENGELDTGDLDLQAIEIASGQDPPEFDLTGDGSVNGDDRIFWLHDLKGTWVGDADLNGLFDSGDFVAVFVEGLYETGEAAGWAQGDWNADLVFDSGDFVAAFVDGGYEIGSFPGAVQAVPEPSSLALLATALGLAFTRGRRGNRQHDVPQPLTHDRDAKRGGRPE